MFSYYSVVIPLRFLHYISLRLSLCLHLSCGVFRIIPGLHIGSAEDDEYSVAHKIDGRGYKEHDAPLMNIFLWKE